MTDECAECRMRLGSCGIEECRGRSGANSKALHNTSRPRTPGGGGPKRRKCEDVTQTPAPQPGRATRPDKLRVSFRRRKASRRRFGAGLALRGACFVGWVESSSPTARKPGGPRRLAPPYKIAEMKH